MWIKQDDEGFLIKVHINPRSSKNSFTGFHEDALSFKITAPALEGRANKALIKFIANFFGLKKRNVIILSGDKSRNKVIKLLGTNLKNIKDKINNIK